MAPANRYEQSAHQLILRRELALFLVLCLAFLSFSKGFVDHIQPWVEGYWVINYNNGLIRRGFLGHILSFFYDQAVSSHVLRAAFWLYIVTCISLIVCFWGWLRRLCADQKGYGRLVAIFAVFATSQFLPTLGYDAGFLDVFDYMLVLVAAIATLGNLYVIAAAIGFVGPFIHEVFIVVWMSLLILLVWNKVPAKRLILLGTAFVATAIVYFGPTEQAGIAQMAAAPLPQSIKEGMIEYQFGQTISASFAGMLWTYRNYFDHFLISVAFFCLAPCIMIVAYGINRKGVRDCLYISAATVAPAAILIVAWDLSRFLVGMTFSALLSIFYMQTARPVLLRRAITTGMCWAVAAISLAIPLVYAFFEKSYVVDLGIISFASSPVGRLLAEGIYPKPPPFPSGNAISDPPGNEWDEEENGFVGKWVRRPGTNMFDATWKSGRITVTGLLVITRAGNLIKVERKTFGGGNDMTYIGTISGNDVSGRYTGGKWFATIR
jgi:hypothetical protein